MKNEISVQKVRDDLKEVRYYYARKELFDEAFAKIGKNKVLSKVERYNQAVASAPPVLYDIYINLYVRNYTQEALSIEMNYTPEYIQMLNKRLVLFLVEKLKEGWKAFLFVCFRGFLWFYCIKL